MISLLDQVDFAEPANDPARYHPPVMVEYGSARDLTRSNNASVVPDGGPINNAVGTEDGGLRAPSQISG